MTTTSIVLGSSGLIGMRLLHELEKKNTNIIAVMRRSEKNLPKKITPLIIDFDDFIVNGLLPRCDHLYICLGTTIKKAGSKAEFRRVDLDYCLAFANKAKESGASKISVVTSIGADAKSSNFYLRTKGLLFKEDEDVYLEKYDRGSDEFYYREIEYNCYDKVCPSIKNHMYEIPPKEFSICTLGQMNHLLEPGWQGWWSDYIIPHYKDQ